MTSSKMDADTMSFGPPKGGPGTYSSYLIKPLLEEFLLNPDFEETIKETSEKLSNNTIAMFLETVFNEV